MRDCQTRLEDPGLGKEPEDISAIAVVRLQPTSWCGAWARWGNTTVSTLAALPLRSVFTPTNLACFTRWGGDRCASRFQPVSVGLRWARCVHFASALLAVADPEYLVTSRPCWWLPWSSVFKARAFVPIALWPARKRSVQALHRLPGRFPRLECLSGAGLRHSPRRFGTCVEIFLPEDGKISFRRRTRHLRIPLARNRPRSGCSGADEGGDGNDPPH